MPHHRIRTIAAIGSLLATVFAAAQSVHPVTGRHIASVMGMGGAPWLDREEREREEHPSAAIAQLNLKPGMHVADIGAGTGFYSLRLAKAVSPGGVVYANDIQPGMLDLLRQRASTENVTNIVPVLGTETDAKLPAGQVDLAIMVDVYHELSNPRQMLQTIRASLKPDGRLVLLEFRKEDPNVPIKTEHKMSIAEVKAEVVPEGFLFEKSVEKLPWQHIIFFKKEEIAQ